MPIVESAGVPIHYEIAGEGPPIVLVHGFMSSMNSWVQTGWVEFLVARGRSVVRMDVRGHGKSGKPHDPTAYENSRMPDDVLAVMDALRLNVVHFVHRGCFGLAMNRGPQRRCAQLHREVLVHDDLSKCGRPCWPDSWQESSRVRRVKHRHVARL
jgi:hypothetical protein